MDKRASLGKNVIILGLGTSLSKVMSVLLVGLYTAHLTTEEFGYYGILITVISMAAPMVTLQITDALYRHLLDARDDGDVSRSVTAAFLVVGTGLTIAIIALVIINIIADISLGWILPGYLAASVMLVFYQQTARGLKRNAVFSISGVVYTGVMLAANIVFIVVLGMGVEALLLSTIIADVVAIVFIEIKVGVLRRFNIYGFDILLVKSMCRYSVPLLPNAVMWWLLLAFNRYAILYFEGLDANGLFEAASKFPTLLITMFNVFSLAWQENAITEYESANRNEYYTKTFRMYVRLLAGGLLLLLPATRHIVFFLLNERYHEAWRLIPFLYLGSIFQAFSYFYAATYMGAKKTLGAFTTTLIGVGGGIAVCLLTMPVLGAQAASLAHMTAFFITWIIRAFHTRKYAKIDFPAALLLVSAALAAAYTYSYFTAVPFSDLLLFIAAIPIFLLLNRELFTLVISAVKKFFQAKRGAA
jgi:O-antigen/teichoic acid export membrane protein